MLFAPFGALCHPMHSTHLANLEVSQNVAEHMLSTVSHRAATMAPQLLIDAILD